MDATGSVEAPLNTVLLREGQEDGYSRLRTLLAEKGMDPDVVGLAECFPDDNRLWFGIVVSPDGRVYEFDYDFRGSGDIRTQMANGVLAAWTETTGNWRGRPFDDSVEATLRFLGTEG